MTPNCWWLSSSRSTAGSRLSTAFDLTVLEVRPGFLLAEAKGEDAADLFTMEAGGHRWQRVPPNEKRGRVHTSTVTVAVLPAPSFASVHLRDTEVEWQATRGSGAGGQHRNKTDSAVQVRHKPTGIMVRCEAERSQHRNRETAMQLLAARLQEQANHQTTGERNSTRRQQVGSGMRGDKIRTIRLQDNMATDHRTGNRIKVDDFLAGRLDLFGR
jgi:peptide chain release factor 1